MCTFLLLLKVEEPAAHNTNVRCAVVPHIGSATTEARIGMATLAIENAMAVLTGKPMPKELVV